MELKTDGYIFIDKETYRNAVKKTIEHNKTSVGQLLRRFLSSVDRDVDDETKQILANVTLVILEGQIDALHMVENILFEDSKGEKEE